MEMMKMNTKTVIKLIEAIKNWQVTPTQALNFLNDFYEEDENIVAQIISQRDDY